ncbi:MAG: multifunctional oxoglutarate decarboxylase/oxoglutarate dehydrogenase thiamine pyrophosphate-binding subunit/dihydrolipoyllysine-residue succinyltransferase subunit [Gemmatimonadales bacterium]|nr:multifunctional oxoglutarate decarboxylase/oxoglutarate dehydrogenase thiamine pyrophosphate-binding subunit/dihydrolipoyllysine-residue succinyltransferase subunit [Gemmatimonadales bacterium]NIN48805.1 multifunctional oxoglutarate decarboxylase/oxoglutarate dehydrogenase thiamine pyrophosphate-binding subunit/dihydrolipoyllysine-residue succinyltransferase subunit [Gemmatimonadales bacterium]NIP06269.1 multifunctional oxoglutarate decarboxylase/oxoglutarate dehydrogenase thiamine pyrophospha
MFEDIFETVNSGFAQALYEDYLRDPDSVPEEWRRLFEDGMKGEEPVGGGGTEGGVGAVDAAAEESPAPSAPPAPSPSASLEPITGPALRQLRNMQASLEVPTATSFRDVDVSRLWAVRAALNRELQQRNIKLSFTHFIGWAIIKAVKHVPSMAHTVAQEGDQHFRVEPGGVNLGLAVDTVGKAGERKLVVPVIKNAHQMAFDRFHEEYERLVAGARDGKLLPDAYVGAAVTLTNPGMIGTVASVPRLMKGQGSIIATGAIRNVAGAKMMTMTSTYDHRIIQGAESGVFLSRLDDLLQGEGGFYEGITAAMNVDLMVAEGAVGAEGAVVIPSPAPSAPAAPTPPAMLYHVAAAMSLVKTHRTHGYLAAHLDPLGTEPRGDPALEPANLDLTPEIMRQIPAAVLRTYVGGETLQDVLPRLRDTYCGTIAYEIEHIASHEERVWLRRVIESGEHRHPLSDEEKHALLEELTRVDVLERFLHKNYLGHKRFGIEGLDMMVPMLHRALDLAGDEGTCEAVIGMAHRGRLNVLAHILGVSYETLLAEFEGGREVEETLTPIGGTGDVKYHHGATGIFETWRGLEVDVSLMPNPSHLEAVDPVVAGNARARQTNRSGPQPVYDFKCVLPILIHGDAAFAAQGVVAETINLARLEGYSTGGTLHIISNNQVGFTTNPNEARSTDFASDLAKGFDVPIVHVNADDAEACLAAVRLALMYRKRFRHDVVINLVGYRRHGHNEGDEPRYTQPLMYQRIDEHPTVRELYATTLIEHGLVTEEQAERMAEQAYSRLSEMQAKLKADIERAEEEGEEPQRISGLAISITEPTTAVERDLLVRLNEELLTFPDGFRVNRKLQRVLERRRKAVAEGGSLDWAHSEALALAALLTEGVPLRVVGQDTVRGTFSQRHLTLFDAENGKPHTPIQHLTAAKAPMELHNTPLSEYAAMGFEYGYSVAAPKALVIWEAQFGDFANAGEVIIDQFIIAGLAKWGQTSRLTLLLPHGYEGQGPEHSSARLERYLALGAEGNIRVANCSTPAQYFHLLRRQAKHQEARPLIVMTPKSLLRLPQATSPVAELTEGEFHPVLDDPALPGARDTVRRLALCSGKVYYDVVGSPRRAEARQVAIGRIELLYPFPEGHVHTLIESYPNLDQVVWLQEEPMNMGARKWVVPQLEALAHEGLTVRYVSRPERSSPAEGYPAAHQAEQQQLVSETLDAS